MPVQGSYWILSLSCTYRRRALLFPLSDLCHFFTAVNIQGNNINIPSGSPSYAAIDTGTTLIGGPSEYIAQIFAQIPGSAPGTGDFQNYYTYRMSISLFSKNCIFLFSPQRISFYLFISPPACDTTVNVSLSFGGSKSWTVSPADFQLSRLTRASCLGAFFELSTGSSAPSWVVGDTFLVSH